VDDECFCHAYFSIPPQEMEVVWEVK
jgi:hypothetical protein